MIEKGLLLKCLVCRCAQLVPDGVKGGVQGIIVLCILLAATAILVFARATLIILVSKDVDITMARLDLIEEVVHLEVQLEIVFLGYIPVKHALPKLILLKIVHVEEQ